MARNRFEQVDEIQPDAVTLVLKRESDGETGSIIFPATASGGRLSTDQISGQLPAQDAYRGAIRLAKQLGPGHTIVTVLCDSGNRYQSKLFNPDFMRSKHLPVPEWLERHSSISVPFEQV